MRATLCLLATIASPLFAGEPTNVEVTVQSKSPGITIPSDFLGLSYEKSAITEKHFRPDNAPFMNLHRNLGDCVIRIGGNKVELCDWQPRSSESNAASTHVAGTNAGSTNSTKEMTHVTPEQVDQFCAFTKGINWKVIYGVNLASNDPSNSAEEISCANTLGGKSILAFEIGNEPDHYYHPPKKTFREKGYSYEQYKKEFGDALRVILAKNPGVPLAGPANTSEGNAKWFAPCVSDFKGQITLATAHFYPTSNKEPFPTIEKLLSSASEERSVKMAEANMAVAGKAGTPFRLAECNSTSLGGTEGVSDVHASSVWGSDFLFDIAERGVVGVNLHTILGLKGYTPIAFDKTSGTYIARPLYYSLLLFKDAGHGKVLPAQTKSASNVTAHATLGEDHKIRVVVINKELAQPATATISTDTARTVGTVARLSGNDPSDKEGTSYSGMTVNPDGTLPSPKTEPINGDKGKFVVTIPACSAAVLTIEPL